MKLNIGCGYDYKEGYVNIDNTEEIKTDLCMNPDEERLPYKKNSVEEIYCRHTYEHFENPLFVLEEFYRVVKKGGKIIIITPFGFNLSDTLFHKTNGFHHKTFRQFYGDERPYFSRVRLKGLDVRGIPRGKWKILPERILRYFSQYIQGVYEEIYFELEVIK